MNGDAGMRATTPSPDELGRLAQLVFASRTRVASASIAGRHLAFLPPDALDMDLSDPLQRDFGDYELLEKIGQGGMGVVYRARQHSLDREVALKLLAAGPWASNDFIERFRREAQSAARLEHPNIVAVHDCGTQHDLQYFSMRLVRGESLAARIARDGPLRPREAARLLRVVADALDYAHRLGVLHLDLKPGNVLIDENGEPMVADFGLARRIDQAIADDGDEVSGTPSYMAPEQALADGRRVSRATDIYGLGGILYESLTGRPPFLAATPQATLESVVRDAVAPPRALDPRLPPDLDAICRCCLDKDPQRRYASAALLAEDLRSFLADRPVSVRQPDPAERVRRWIRREPRMAAAVALVALSLFVGLVATLHQWRRAEANATTARALAWEGRRAAALRLAQDGEGHAALGLLVDNLREAEAAGAADVVDREQRRIGLLQGQGATLVDRIAIDDANPFAVAVAPAGDLLAIGLNDMTVRWYDTGTLRERGRVSLAGRVAPGASQRLPQLLRFVDPGRLLVALQWYSNQPNPTYSDSWLVDLASASVIEPPPAFADFANAQFSADGRHALLRDRRHRVQWWSVDPWAPRSPIGPDAKAKNLWILDRLGRFAMRLETGQEAIDFFRLPGLRFERSLELPGQVGISAWAQSGDGRLLALGDFGGRAYLFDIERHQLRALPNARSREIAWIAFSEDDAWVASASFDGLVFAFDVATGDPLHAGQMRHDFAVRRVALSHAQRLLVASGEGRVALWRLSRPGPRAAPAQRIGLGPAPHGLAAQYAADWSLERGLLASAGLDGQVRLWRLPRSPTLPARAPRQRAERLEFDGDRLLDAAWDQFRLVDGSGRGLGPWRRWPQPPGLATLTDGGRLLLATLGPELHFQEALGGHAVAPVQSLPDSPQRLLTSPGGRRVLLSFGEHHGDGFRERLLQFDARSGAALPGEARLAGPVRRYAYAADGRRLLAVGPAHAATTVLDGEHLGLLAEYANDPFEPVQWADFTADGRVLLATRASDARIGTDRLLRWDPLADRVEELAEVPLSEPLGAVALDARGVVAGLRRDVLVDADGAPRAVERLARTEATAVLAVDPAGRVLARGYRHEVQLHDTRTLEPLGPPLQADISAIDGLEQLAFAPDGQRLVAVSRMGAWLQWPVAADRRDADALAAALAPLAPENEDPRQVVVPGSAEREALRRRDPGPWATREPRPEPSLAPARRTDEAIPARMAGLPAHLLDLGPHYDTGPDAERNPYYNVLPGMRPLPIGRQRIGGVDFDIRGMAQVTSDAPPHRPIGAQSSAQARIDCVAAEGQSAAAVRLLVATSLPEPAPTGTVLARLRFRYLDGSSAEASLLAGRDLPGHAGDDATVPLAFAGQPGRAWAGVEDFPLGVPRVENPHPQRALRCLDVEAVRAESPLALFAITLESYPVIAAAPLRRMGQ